MAWLAFVLVWLAVTTLRGREQRFVAGAVAAGFVTLLLLNVVAPDALVARTNIARAARATSGGGTPLDLDYLATLSGDAMAIAIPAIVAPPTNVSETTRDGIGGAVEMSPVTQRCLAARRIRARWGPSSRNADRLDEPGAWRQWNAGDSRALRVAADNARALLAVQHEACAAARLAGARVGNGAFYR